MNFQNYKTSLRANQFSRIAKLFFLIILLLLINCNTVWAYTKDRKNDFFDIITVGVNTGIGAEAHIGPVPIGLGGAGQELGLINGCWTNESEHLSFLIVGYEKVNCENAESNRGKDILYKYGLWNEKKLSEKKYLFTRMDFSAAYLVGARLGFNSGELLDFFVGFFGFDLYHDDMHHYQILTETIGEKNMNIIKKYYSE